MGSVRIIAESLKPLRIKLRTRSNAQKKSFLREKQIPGRIWQRRAIEQAFELISKQNVPLSGHLFVLLIDIVSSSRFMPFTVVRLSTKLFGMSLSRLAPNYSQQMFCLDTEPRNSSLFSAFQTQRQPRRLPRRFVVLCEDVL